MSDDIADLVIDDIRDRKKVGMRNYGHALKANNGRNALRDLYEELLDAAQYCKQELIERAALRDELERVKGNVEVWKDARDRWWKDCIDQITKVNDLEVQLAAAVAERDAMRVRYEEAVGLLRRVNLYYGWDNSEVGRFLASLPEPKEQTGELTNG